MARELLVASFKQKDVERAVRAAMNAGTIPVRIDFKPDGNFSLCFGESRVGAEDGLDHEMDQWKRKNATN
jgi:hypothetical protein